MGLNHSPSTVSSGLVLCVDAANPQSLGWSNPVANIAQVQVLVVAGGGGGGGGRAVVGGGGGGGAGGVVYTENFNLLTFSVPVTVVVGAGGAGGVGGNITATQGTNGNNSSFGTLVAIGGGGGGLAVNGGNPPGSNGGSGGGGGAGSISGPGAGGAGTAGQGNAGGVGWQGSPYRGGGGGGAGAVGGAGGTTGTQVAAGGGGIGLFYGNIFGNSLGQSGYVAGGGSGGLWNSSSNGSAGGGLGGGGTGTITNGNPGLPNTGGGGAGGGINNGADVTYTAGAGGSGVVAVRYPGAQQALGGTVTTAGGFTTHTFTASGTFIPLTWRDVSGQSNYGILVNSPTFNSANSGSIVFNGTNQYVAGSIATINSWSMCLWYLSTDITSQAVFYPFSGTTTATGLGFGGTSSVDTINRWYFFDGTNVFSGPNTAVTTNVWYNLVVTKSSTTYSLYTNGTLSLTGTGVDLALTQYNLGRRGNGEWYAQGNIAQASIYNRALTAQEVNQNFQALRGRFGI